jgi:hypothetical protein
MNVNSIEFHDSARIDWMYPCIYAGETAERINNSDLFKNRVTTPLSGERDFIEITLMHVRASNSIRIEYDSDRDGWIIFSPVTVYTPKEKTIDCIEEHVEVAFVPAWPFGGSTEFPEHIDGPTCLLEVDE